MCAACYNRHVNGSTSQQARICDKTVVAVIDNNTDRDYTLYVRDRIVGTAEPRTMARIPIDPELAGQTPTLRESPSTRGRNLGRTLGPRAYRLICE
jgi:hypothetical protein